MLLPCFYDYKSTHLSHPTLRPNIWPKMGFPELFEKNYWPNSFHTWNLPLWGESLDPYTFSCSWPYFRPSGGQIFGRKWGLWNFLKKLLAQFISYLTFILMGWVLLTPIHFGVPSLIFGPLVAKYLAENGISGIFWKNYWLNSFHTWYLSLWGESLDPYTFSCS